jgi:hypothetical protein
MYVEFHLVETSKESVLPVSRLHSLALCSIFSLNIGEFFTFPTIFRILFIIYFIILIPSFNNQINYVGSTFNMKKLTATTQTIILVKSNNHLTHTHTPFEPSLSKISENIFLLMFQTLQHDLRRMYPQMSLMQPHEAYYSFLNCPIIINQIVYYAHVTLILP